MERPALLSKLTKRQAQERNRNRQSLRKGRSQLLQQAPVHPNDERAGWIAQKSYGPQTRRKSCHRARCRQPRSPCSAKACAWLRAACAVAARGFDRTVFCGRAESVGTKGVAFIPLARASPLPSGPGRTKGKVSGLPWRGSRPAKGWECRQSDQAPGDPCPRSRDSLPAPFLRARGTCHPSGRERSAGPH